MSLVVLQIENVALTVLPGLYSGGSRILETGGRIRRSVGEAEQGPLTEPTVWVTGQCHPRKWDYVRL